MLSACDGLESELVLSTEAELAQLMFSWGAYEQAARLLRELLRKIESTPSKSPRASLAGELWSRTLVSLDRVGMTVLLADALCKLQEHAEAEKLYLAAVQELGPVDLGLTWNKLARLHQQQERWQQAYDAAGKAAEVFRSIEGSTGRKLLPEALYELAAAQKGLGQLLEAQHQIEHGLALEHDPTEPKQPAGSVRSAKALVNLGSVLRLQGDLTAAHKACSQAVSALQAIQHESAAEKLGLAAALLELSAVEEQQGELEQALEHSRQAQALWMGIRESSGAEVDEGTVGIGTLVAEARLLVRLERHSEAELCFRKVLEMQSCEQEATEPQRVNTMRRLGSILLKRGQLVEAETLLSRVALGGAEPPPREVWRPAMRELARCRMELDRAGEALMLLEQVLDSCAADAECSPADLIEIKHELSAAHRANGDPGQGLSILRQIEEVERPCRSRKTINNMACMLADMGEYEQARKLFEEVAVIETRELGNQHPELADSYMNIAKLNETALRVRDAEQAYKKAIQVLECSSAEALPACLTLAEAISGLALLYDTQLRVKEAEEMYCKALLVQRSALAPHHPDILNTLSSLCKLHLCHSDQLGMSGEAPGTLMHLGQLFHDSGDLEQAQWHLKKALELLQEKMPPTHPQLASVVLALHQLYEDIGDQEQVQHLSNRLSVINRYLVAGVDLAEDPPLDAGRHWFAAELEKES